MLYIQRPLVGFGPINGRQLFIWVGLVKVMDNPAQVMVIPEYSSDIVNEERLQRIIV